MVVCSMPSIGARQIRSRYKGGHCGGQPSGRQIRISSSSVSISPEISRAPQERHCRLVWEPSLCLQHLRCLLCLLAQPQVLKACLHPLLLPHRSALQHRRLSGAPQHPSPWPQLSTPRPLHQAAAVRQTTLPRAALRRQTLPATRQVHPRGAAVAGGMQLHHWRCAPRHLCQRLLRGSLWTQEETRFDFSRAVGNPA